MILFALTACNSPFFGGLDAPDAVEDLMVFGLLNYEEARGREAFVNQAQTAYDEHQRRLRDGLRVDSLTSEDLLAGGLSQQLPEDGTVVGVAATLSFDSDFEDVVRVLTGDMSQVVSGTRTYERAAYDPADRDCFLARDCDALDIDVSREVGGFWGTAIQDVTVQFRWVERSDGTEVFLFRGMAPEPFETDSTIYQTNQHYQFYSMVDGPDGPTKLEAHWVDAIAIGVPVPDQLLADGAVNEMKNHRDQIDDFIADGGTN
jgi:hypothetical protein